MVPVSKNYKYQSIEALVVLEYFSGNQYVPSPSKYIIKLNLSQGTDFRRTNKAKQTCDFESASFRKLAIL